MKIIMPLRISCIAVIYIFGLAIILSILNSGCDSVDNKDKPNPEPNLVIVGEDLSGTFKDFPKTTEEDLRALCNAVGKSKWGGRVYLIGIGNSTPKGYVFCLIKRLKEIPPDATPSEIFDVRSYNKKIQKVNTQKIDEFLEDASVILQQQNQKDTDINGFLEKVASIVNVPDFNRYKKWLYVNSDGRQDNKGIDTINCDLLPTIDKYFVNKGWKNKTNCGAAGNLPDTEHFVEYFKQNVSTNSNPALDE